MSEQPAPSALVRRTVRLERRQWERIARLADQAGITQAETHRQIVDLGANDFEHALSNDGGPQ